MKMIDKDALVAEIEKIREHIKRLRYAVDANCIVTVRNACECLESSIDLLVNSIGTLEVKEVEEKYKCPNIKIKDAIEVSSRMKYVDKDLKPIADFIMDYASWNLHKDEWNQPVIEVPLFRVLDALVQRGKPYCEG